MPCREPGRLSTSPALYCGKVSDRGTCLVNGALVGVAVWATGADGQNSWTSPLSSNSAPLGHKAPLCCGSCAAERRACVLPAPLYPSLPTIAQLLLPPASSSSPGFPHGFLFSQKRGLIQCVLCSFPGLYPSHNTKSSKRMGYSHTRQCCTHG